jgi:hypothetical protein
MPRRSPFILACWIVLVTSGAAADDGMHLPEQFDYQWSLAGFKGVVARLFVPGRGEGRLTTAPSGQDDRADLLTTELLISSNDGKEDEFWLYGAEIDAFRKRTVRSWSAQRFRGKSRTKEREAGDIEALDLASSIYYLRRERPDVSSEQQIWSSGRLNPVLIQPGERGVANWKGREVATRSYSIEGVSRPGRQKWEGHLNLVLTDDEDAIPLEIVVMRSGLRIRLELVDVAR